VAGFFLLLTGYPNWHGGWALGDRYLIPVAFFAGLAVARGLESSLSRGLFAAAVVFSVASEFLMTASWPHFWIDLPWPAANGSLWFLRRRWIAPNLFSGLGPVSILPAAAVVAAAAVAALRAARPLSPRPAVSLPVAAAVLAAALLFAPEPAYDSRLLRAGIFGAYSGVDSDRRELTRVIESAANAEERRRGMLIWLQYGKGAASPLRR
jgi:hypothetical protein